MEENGRGGDGVNCHSRLKKKKKKRLPHSDLQVWAERILQETQAASCWLQKPGQQRVDRAGLQSTGLKGPRAKVLLCLCCLPSVAQYILLSHSHTSKKVEPGPPGLSWRILGQGLWSGEPCCTHRKWLQKPALVWEVQITASKMQVDD